MIFSQNGYRLPTEAEREKASRGGLTGHHYPWDSLEGTYDQHIDPSRANYGFNVGSTTPVGYYNGSQTPAGVDMANGYGLYDMAGNQYEWCWDRYSLTWYSDPGATVHDSSGPTNGSSRVVRGGSYGVPSDELRCANRNGGPPSDTVGSVGFRSARGL